MTSTHPSALAPGFAALKEELADRYDLSEPLTVNDAAALLREVADLAADLSLIRSGLEEQLAANMETDRVDTPAGPLIRRYKPEKPKWEGRKLALEVADRVPPADEDGQPYSPDAYCRAVLEEVIATSGIDNASHKWRSTALKARGIEPKDYCSADGWRVTVGFLT